MIDIKYVKDILLDIPYISNIIVKENFPYPYTNKGFLQGLQCDLLLDNQPSVSLFIGIPENWELNLISIYVMDIEYLPFMPHVEPDGKLCLFDLEGILIDINFEGIINQCVHRAKSILEAGFSSSNKSEFVKEFSSYWIYQNPLRNMKFAVPETHKTQLIKFCDPAKTISQMKKENSVAFEERKKKLEIFAAAESKFFSIWEKQGTQYDGMFFHLEPTNYILPPDPRNKLDLEYVNMLFSYIPSKEFKPYRSKIKKNTLIVFEILEPGNMVVCFGIMLNDILIEADDIFLNVKPCSNKYKLIAVCVSRIDDEFLKQRTQYGKRDKTPNILIIGCGSIGGYLCSELVKSGYYDLTLVDKYFLKAENIYRHFLGREYVGRYKAKALYDYCSLSFPNAKIKPLDSDVISLIEDESVDLRSFDLIISAAGNHNLNRWLNRKLNKECMNVPCIYLWNEPLDIGCHLAIISSEYPGCYECFFSRNSESNVLYDVTAYTKPGQVITKNNRGCSGSFVPYASNVSLRIVSSCMEWIERLFTGRFNGNVLVSIKGDAYKFTNEGFKCSNVYYDQEIKEKVIEGSDFICKSCEVCGEYTNGDQ